LAVSSSAQERPTLDLSGEWRFAMDRSNQGEDKSWFLRTLADRIKLPGILQSQGYGDEISIKTPWVLSLYDRNWFEREEYKAYTKPGSVRVPFLSQPPRHYVGVAWYQRDVRVPGLAGQARRPGPRTPTVANDSLGGRQAYRLRTQSCCTA